MTKDEALDLALEALEKSLPRLAPYGEQDWLDSRAAITAIKQARSAPVQPLADAMKTVIEAMQKDPDYAWGWHCNIAMAFVDAGGDHFTGNQGAARFMKMLANVEPAHELPSPPAAIAAPVQPVAFEVSLVEWVGNKLMATPKVTATPPASWMETVTANLVREGVNKHKARELAEHFYSLAQRPWVGLTDEDYHTNMFSITSLGACDIATIKSIAKDVEAKLKEKNNG